MTWHGILKVIIACLLAATVIGCGQRIDNREAIAALLPKELKLGDRIPVTHRYGSDPQFGKKTVEQVLMEIGAKVGPNNTLLDRNDKEIVFVWENTGGTAKKVDGGWVAWQSQYPEPKANQTPIVYKITSSP